MNSPHTGSLPTRNSLWKCLISRGFRHAGITSWTPAPILRAGSGLRAHRLAAFGIRRTRLRPAFDPAGPSFPVSGDPPSKCFSSYFRVGLAGGHPDGFGEILTTGQLGRRGADTSRKRLGDTVNSESIIRSLGSLQNLCKLANFFQIPCGIDRKRARTRHRPGSYRATGTARRRGLASASGKARSGTEMGCD
jgi:hypothetical protein